MLEIRRTTDFQPDITALEAVIDSARLRTADEFEDWPDDRLVMSECVVLNDGQVVGFGRMIWDAHLDEIDISRRAREQHDESLGRSPGRLRA